MALGNQRKPQAVTNTSIRKKKQQRLFLSIAACMSVLGFYSFKTFYPVSDSTMVHNRDLKEKEIIIPDTKKEVFEEKIITSVKNDIKKTHPVSILKEEKPTVNEVAKSVVDIPKKTIIKHVEVLKKAEKVAEKKITNEVKKVIKIAKIEKLSNTIAEQYNVSPQKAKIVVKKAYELSKIHNVDPMTIIGITAVESEFNERAKNPSGAVGLMQPLPKAHPDKIKALRKKGGSLYNIADNMEIGTSIYSEYLHKHNGNRTKALQQYNGASKDKRHIYAKKVERAIHEIQLAHN